VNPLSPLTYYWRHKRHTLLLASLVTLVTIGISIMVGMMHPILQHQAAMNLGALSHFGIVYPTASSSLDPAVVAQIRAHPDVARTMPENGMGLWINVPSLGIDTSFRMLGVQEPDVQALVDTCGLRVREGRLPNPRTNEIALSKEATHALGLRIGDQIDRSIDERRYWSIPSPLVLVGILESDPLAETKGGARLAIVPYEYLDSHELYAPRQTGLLVVAQKGRRAAVDDFMEKTILSPRAQIQTYQQKVRYVVRTRRTVNLVIGIVDCLVAGVVALVVGMINQIAVTRRLTDLGVLHAIGHRRGRLIRRLTLEVAILAGAGWLAGLALSWAALAWLKSGIYEPRGVDLDLANLAPLWFSVPIPLAVIGLVVLSIVRTFARLDAVAIIERGKLGTETQSHKAAVRRSLVKPLSTLTFYLRHRRRGLAMVLIMGLMILGVAFPVFFFSPLIDAQKPFYVNHLSRVGEVSPGTGGTIDPGVVAQIRAHPSVARAIPATMAHLAISIPPVAENVAQVYGVSEDDMPYLVDTLGLQLQAGRLPRARANEIILAESIALNRGLVLGDMIGCLDYARDHSLPADMVVVGILSGADIALGFVSLEYIQGHELYAAQSNYLLVVPHQGHKAEIDRWLEESIASTRTLVNTFDVQLRDLQRAVRSLILLIAAVEGVVAIVAAIALATLNHIFFEQRRSEFGILNAVGRSRPWLLFRTTRETVSTVGAAWLLGAVVCVISLVYAQANVYAPVGIRLDLFSLAPWLFTLPVPLAVVSASTGTIARMLRSLDPVTVIEGKA
jgi:ABC-type lipoprotein release transport system permease subunit